MHLTLSTWLYTLAAVAQSNLLFVESNSDSGINETDLNYRLPNETYPEHYEIELRMKIDLGEKAFQGQVIIDIVIAKETSTIVLHGRELKAINATGENLSTSESEDLLVGYEVEREFLILRRKNNQQFAAETQWKVTITYSGKLSDIFGLSWYIDFNSEGRARYMLSTELRGAFARRIFPCFDEPDKRAYFTITIYHSPTQTALSNKPANKALSSPGKTVFLTTERIPTYFINFAIIELDYTESVLNGLSHRVYSLPSTKNKHNRLTTFSMTFVEHLMNYYGIAFKTNEFTYVAIPQLGDENHSFNDDFMTNVLSQTNMALNIAQTLSETMLCDYVIIKWWTYSWLTRGLATYISYKALDQMYPQWNVWQGFHTLYSRSLTEEAWNILSPISLYVQKPNEITSSVWTNRSKAIYILHMWISALSDEVFQKGIRNYLIKNQNVAVDENHFFAAIQTVVQEKNYRIPASIREMIGTWTHQNSYPILTVTRDYDKGTFAVHQEAFYVDVHLSNNKTWYVPINYAIASHPDFQSTEATHYLLNCADMELNDVAIPNKDWLILNKQSTGYYRINYDIDNWNLIADALIERPNRIHYRNRAQLLDDAFQFTSHNRLDHGTLFKLLSYLKQEDQYAPWVIAKSILKTYNQYLHYDESHDFKFFVADLVRPMYKKIGMNYIPGEHQYHKHLRFSIMTLACEHCVQECIDDARNELKNFFEKKQINYDSLRHTDFIYDSVLNSTDQGLYEKLIFCVICTENVDEIKKLLYKSMDYSNSLASGERQNVVRSICSRSDVSLLACIEFLGENWRAFSGLKTGRNKPNPLYKQIRYITSSVISENQQKKLLALVATIDKTEFAFLHLKKHVKTDISNKLKWVKNHGEPIMSWLSNYRTNHST